MNHVAGAAAVPWPVCVHRARARRPQCDGGAWGVLLAAALVCGLSVAEASAQTVTLSVPSGAVLAEGGGSTDIVVTATLSAARTSATTVTLSLGGDSARSTDYTSAPLPSITIAAGETTGSATVTASAVDDNFYEGAETVDIDGSAGALTVNGVSVDVTDNETRPTFELQGDRASVREGESVSVTWTVTLLGGATLEDDLSVEFVWGLTNIDPVSTGDLTMTPSLPHTVTISAGSSSATVTFTFAAVDDEDGENRERALIRADAQILGQRDSGVQSVEIPENDGGAPSSTLLLANLFLIPRSVDAGESTTVSAVLGLDEPAATGVTVTYMADDSDKESWIDPHPFSFVLSEGDTRATSEFTVTPPADYHGQFNLDTTDGLEGYILPNQWVVVRSAGNPVLTHSWVSGSPSSPAGVAFRTGDSFRVEFSFSRYLEAASATLGFALDSGVVEVPCTVGRRDYGTELECTYTIRSGDYDLDGRIQLWRGALSITAGPDGADLDYPVVPGAAEGMGLSAPIWGGDQQVVLSVSPQSLQEGVGATDVTITAVDRANLSRSGALVVPIAFADGTATDADYDVSGTLSITIPAGSIEGSTTVRVTPVEDRIKEAQTEVLRIVAGPGMPDTFVLATELRILDAPDIELSVSRDSIAEDGGAQPVTVTAEVRLASDGSRTRAIPVTLRFGGGAVVTDDFTVSGTQVVTIPASARTASTTLTLTPVNDRLLEMDETIEVDGTADGHTVAGTGLTLVDDERQPQVILAVDDDAVAESDTGATAVSVTATLDPSVMVSDDVVATLALGGSATEGASGDYTAAWSPAAAQLTVRAGTNQSVAPVTLTLTPRQDFVAEGDETIVVEGVARVSNAAMDALTVVVASVTLEDDDTAGARVTPTELEIDEGDTATYTVALTSQPTAEVLVAMTAPLSDTDVSVSTEVLTFTTSNWRTAQTITVTAAEDDDKVAGETVTLTHTASGGGYDAVRLDDVVVTIVEDEAGTYTLTVSPSMVAKNGGVSTVTISRSAAATVDEEFSLLLAGTASEGEDYEVGAQRPTLEAGQTSVSTTVTGLSPLDDPFHSDTVVVSAIHRTAVVGLPQTITLTSPEAELVLSATSLPVDEGGEADYTVALGTQPNAAVTVSISGASGTDLSLDKSSLTFTTTSWETAQTVTVTAGDDGDALDDTATLTHTASGGGYSSATASVSVTIADDETLGLVLSPSSLPVDEGAAASYTVRLGSEPTATVRVTIGGTAGTDLSLDKSALTFTTGNWSTAQSVTVSAAADADAVDDTATLTHTASGGDYGSATGSVSVTVDDDETADLVLSKTALNPSEGGSESYTAALGSEPTATVRVTIGGTAGTELSLSPSSLTFTTGNWSTAQTVTVTAGDDADAVDDTATLTHTASGGDYGSVSKSVSVTVDDDETTELVLSKTSLKPSEGSNESYTVKLGSQPTATVRVTIGGTAGTDLSLDKSGLTFTTTNWNTVQSVTVTAGDDGDAIDDTATLTHTASGGDYGSVSKSLSVTVDDDETLGLVFSKTSLNPSEDDGESYTVRLGSQPTATVTVTLGGTSGTDLSLDKSVLTFTTGNWSTAQSVTVSAAADADAVDDTATLTHTASGGDYGSVTGSVSVTVDDDETAELVFSKASLNPSEGSNESYTVKLGSQPTATVTVTIGGTTGTDLSLDKSALTFTTGNWSTAQSVTVTAGPDADAVDDTATLTHTASGGDYGSVTKGLSVTVDDDETAELVFSKTSLNPSEGSNESYTVKLGSEPTASVTVTIAGTSGTELSLDKSSLTFTTGNWSTAQSVTVTAGPDADAVDDTATLTHTASGGDYGSVTGSVSVTVDDDETAELVFSKTSLNPSEGSNESYTVKLGSEPTATVTVSIGGTTGTDLSLDKSGLTFTTGNWSTAQSVTVTAGPDADAVDDTATLTHTASGGDYGSVTGSVSVTVDDDETAALVLSKASLNPSEGSNESYTVKLGSAPTASVTVTIGGTTGTDLSLDKSGLTFTTGNWSTAQSVTVTAGPDADAVDDTATLTHTASGGDYGSVTKGLSVTVDDDETAGLVLSKASLKPSEGSNESYTVKLSSAPTASVTVTIAGTSGTELSLDKSSLTFTTATWSTAQSVTVTAGPDADAVDDTATLTHTASGGDYGSVTGSVSVTVDDDETAALVFSKASLNPSEGSNESYTVKLGSAPTASVTVSIGGTTGTDLSLDKSSLTFTTATWSTAQSVTVTAGPDADAVDDTATLTHTASGGDYGSVTGSVSVTVDDDETAELVLSRTSLPVLEGGRASYTVKLGSAPTASVTVSIGGTTGTDLSLDKSSLTFTTATWSTVQSVTVTAGPDADAVNDTATLTHAASGGDYGSVSKSVSVTVTDDESAGLALSKTSLKPSEGGSESYTVRLSSEPTASVTVTIGGTTGTDLSLDKSGLTFTTANWSTAQSVTVTAGPDADAVDDTATLTHTASGGDYGSVTGSVSVTVDDDETAALVLSKASLKPSEGGSESYTVRLSSEPTASVTVTIGGTTGTDLSLDKSGLTFTTANWSTAQSVTVTAGPDADAVDDTATLTHTASGGDYGSVTGSVSVTVDDDETANLVLSKASLNPSEGGSESYTVKLGSEPSASVTVTIGGTTGTDLSLSASILTFTTTNWNTAQSVTVTAGPDADAVDDEATLTHSASGGNYGSVTGSVSVTVDDDETAGLVLSKASLNPSEGGSESYTVKLGSEPSASVTVTVGGTSGTDLSLDKSGLTFTTATWNTVQSVTVTAGDDADAVDDTATLTHTASGGDYGSVTGSVSVTVDDDETADLVLSVASVEVAEGGSESYTVKLSTQPTASVTVTVSGTSGTDLSLDKSSLTFTTASWNTAQSVTVTAGDDADAVDDTATLTHTASGGDYGSESGTVSVTVTDDETAALVLSKTSLTVDEGGEASYTVKLGSEPTASVTVTVGGTSDTDLSLDKSSLTFTTTSWNTAQSVTVTAGDDADAVDDEATLTHTASGGDYGSVTRSVTVTVADDETAGLVPSPASLDVDEGATASYTLKLSTQPSASVTVSIGGTTDTDLSLSATSLTFTTTSWGTVQTVTVTAGQDDDAVDDEATLTHTASGGDYGSVTRDLAVTVADDETVGLTLSKASLNPTEGGNEHYTLKLSTEPTASVTVTVGGTTDTDLSLSVSSLTFTTTSWSTVQTVTVTAGQDDDAEDDEATLTHAASGGGYDSVSRDLPVTVDDDESAGLVLSTATLEVVEGKNAGYTVRLTTRPSGEVTVSLAGTSGTDLSLSDAVLTFTTTSWSTAQTVTVSAEHDEDEEDDAATLTHTASGGGYDSVSRDLAVTVVDDDGVELTLAVDPSEVAEDGGETDVTVTATLLGAAGSEELVVTVTVSGDSAGADDFTAVPPFELRIPAEEETGTARFRLTPADDELIEGPETLSVSGEALSGQPVRPAVLTLVDDDREHVALSVSPAMVDEGAGDTTVTVTATLHGELRTGATVITVTVAEDAAQYAAAPASFDIEIPAGWTSGTGTFVLTPEDDADDEPDLRVMVTGTTNPLPVEETAVTIRDDDASNAAPEFERERYVFDLPENRSGRETPVVLGTVAASDTDGDRLRYVLEEGDRERFRVGRTEGNVDYVGEGEDFEADAPRYELTVTARDGEHGAQVEVLVRVVDAPERPEADDDSAETPEDTPKVIDVLANDSDPDGDRLRVASVAAPEHGTATVVSGGVRYEPELNWYGEDRFRYTVSDPGGLTSKATVKVTVTPVNDPPEAVDDEAETLEDIPAVVDVLANDSDVDGDPLEVVSVGPAGHGTTAVVSGGVRYASELNWYGTDRFTYTIADPEGLTATATVTMTVHPVNDPPEAVGVIPDQLIEEGGPEVTVDLTPYFTDVDGDPLTYEAESSDEMAVTVAVAGATLTLTPVVTGTATVTVTAADVEGLTAVQVFGVSVGDRLVRGVLTDTLAALGRGHLSSARVAIGRRLETGGGGMTRLMVAGQHLSLNAWEQMGAGGVEQSHELLFRAATLRHRRSGADLVGTSADPRLRRPGAAGMMGGGFGGAGTGRDRLLQGTDVLLGFGDRGDGSPAGGGGARWTVWGQGDLQSFRGAPAEERSYEGGLRTGYLGVDARLSERWLAGVAVARSGGSGDWQVGASSGSLATELTVLHPYVRWGGRETAVWALAGVGRGTAENVRALNGRRGTSPLGLGLGLVEGRQRLMTTAGGLELDLRGEASWARLRTGEGEETIDRLEAGVRRVRSGVEVTLPMGGPGGLRVAPFGAVSTRHDGGAGQTGVGLEVAGGVRLRGGRVRVEAQGRTLALHSATEYEERGFSVTATVGGGQYEPGLTASLRPRWGAPGYGAETLWQDHLQSYTQGPARADRGVDGRVGYGLPLSGGRLLTPFGGYGQMGPSRRMQVGAVLGMLGLFHGDLASPVQVEFQAERHGRPGGRADHRVSLYGIVNFGARPRPACNAPEAACAGHLSPPPPPGANEPTGHDGGGSP